MTDNAMQPVVRLTDVRKVFGRGTIDEVQALKGVNLTIHERDFISVIGSNGAGKSTLLNIMAGVFPPERGGKILINDHDVTNLPEYRHAAHAGRVWQQPGVGTARNLTIEENLSMAVMRGRKRGLRLAANKQRRALFREALAPLKLSLEDRLGTLVGTLSGGQRQALCLVMATISKPAILLLDEHTATLDPTTARTVIELTDMIIRQEQMTAMMVTHNMDMALRYGNRLIMMHKGSVMADIRGEEKKALTIGDLIAIFEKAAGEQFKDDNILLRQGD